MLAIGSIGGIRTAQERFCKTSAFQRSNSLQFRSSNRSFQIWVYIESEVTSGRLPTTICESSLSSIDAHRLSHQTTIVSFNLGLLPTQATKAFHSNRGSFQPMT